MEKIQTTLSDPKIAHKFINDLWAIIKGELIQGHRVTVIARPDTRSLAQNRLLWSCLNDLSDQVKWFGKKLSPEGWKDFVTGHLSGQDLMPNMDGTGFIAIGKGKSTSEMTVAEMTALIDLIHQFGTDNEVEWSPQSIASD